MAPTSVKGTFAKRLKNPHSTIRSTFGGVTPFKITLDASAKDGKLSELGYEADAPPESIRILDASCALFVGKTHDECEAFDLSLFLNTLSPPSDLRPVGVFAWNVIQDAIARLPFGDPMSKMIHRISQWHDEFPLGDPKADEED
jgi:hypothetical protein